MIKLRVGLRFPGNCEEAFNFYKSVLGGDFLTIQRYQEVLPSDDKRVPGNEQKMAYIGLRVGNEDVLDGDDLEVSGFGEDLVQGNNISIGINTHDKEEADRVFQGLAAGGRIHTPLADQFWGGYYGCLQDRFGVWWSVSYHE